MPRVPTSRHRRGSAVLTMAIAALALGGCGALTRTVTLSSESALLTPAPPSAVSPTTSEIDREARVVSAPDDAATEAPSVPTGGSWRSPATIATGR